MLDYIYAILHSPTYRETYKEFFKIDFPKVPYPTDTEKFWTLVTLGREIRLYHLLEHPNLADLETSYPIAGSDIITTKIATKDFIVNETKTHGKIMINDTQFFDNIPIIAWEFYIGGYQPAQKWLKDRAGRKLNFDDINHYQKIIKSLTQTHRLMQKIDKVYMNIPADIAVIETEQTEY
jgi:predicted helicase